MQLMTLQPRRMYVPHLLDRLAKSADAPLSFQSSSVRPSPDRGVSGTMQVMEKLERVQSTPTIVPKSASRAVVDDIYLWDEHFERWSPVNERPKNLSLLSDSG